MVALEDRHKLLKGVIFKFVRKYIAGSTLAAALDNIKQANARGMRATVTFLNEGAADAARARYNANTYVQLTKQATRLHLNADISLRLSQVGIGLNNGIADRHIASILDAAAGNGSGIWIEAENDIGMEDLFSRYRELRKKSSSIGIEVPVWYPLDVTTIKNNLKKNDRVKLTTYSHTEDSIETIDEEPKRKKRQKKVIAEKEAYGMYVGSIGRLLQEGISVSVLESNERIVAKLASFSKEYKKSLIFELPLGYSKNSIGKLVKMKANLSVYVPYGKDWSGYVLNKLTVGHGKIRGIAARILEVRGAGNEKDNK